MNKQEFATVIAKHKTGFLLLTGDVNGEHGTPINMSHIYYDTATLTGNNILNLSNKHNKSVSGGKTVISAYGMSVSHMTLDTIESIKEHLGDSLSYVFGTEVQRLFEIKFVNEFHGLCVYTIGLI